MRARIKFNKYGVIKFIGHLDLMRYFQKAFRRANIDIAYSQGYNPHQLMAFASPLGVGLTSDSEYLDVKFNKDYSKEEFLNLINEQMVEGIDIIDFTILKDDAKNSMSSVVAADYIVSVKDEYADVFFSVKDDFISNFKQFLDRKEIKITKKSKKSEKEVDIKPFIYDISFDNNIYTNSVATRFDNGLFVYMKIACGSERNLKPELLMEAFCNYYSIEYNKYEFQIHRLEVYSQKENFSKNINSQDSNVSIDELIPLGIKDIIEE